MITLFEQKLPGFYAVDRVNVYLCDHKRQEIYKIQNDKDNNDTLVFYSSQSGIAGKISNEGKALIANNVTTFFQFIPKIDDPIGKYHSITGEPEEGVINILTIPIYCLNDGLDDSYKHFPIAVILMF